MSDYKGKIDCDISPRDLGYTELIQHRRKRSMDVGFCKVSNGIWRANYIMSMKEVLS